MTVVIENMAGGDRHVVRSLAQLARVAATKAPYGGFRLVKCDGLEGYGEADVRAVLAWAEAEAREAGIGRGNTAAWRQVAERAISYANA